MKINISKKIISIILAGTVISLSACSNTGKIEETEEISIVEEKEESTEIEIVEESKEVVEEIEEVEEIEPVIEPMVIDYNSYDYNIYEYKVVEALDDIDIMDDYKEDSIKLGTFAKGRNFKLIYDENPDYYIIDYYGKEGYIARDNTNIIVKKEANFDTIKVGYITKNTEVYNSAYLDYTVDSLNKLEFVEIHQEFDDCYLVETIDTAGFIKKENINFIDEVVAVVDISNQELRLYENNNMTVCTPVVTGTKGTSRRSDEGFFTVHTIAEKLYIVPGYWVECVDYYNGGEGIHTAEWRTEQEFGGNTYLTNGSHGCINTPTEEAEYVHKVFKEEIKVKKHKCRVLVKE